MSYVSIHAPMKGATSVVTKTQWETLVSIHAPMKGATIWYRIKQLQQHSFNPRSHEGSDGSPGTFQPGGDSVSIHAPMKGATRQQ